MVRKCGRSLGELHVHTYMRVGSGTERIAALQAMLRPIEVFRSDKGHASLVRKPAGMADCWYSILCPDRRWNVA